MAVASAGPCASLHLAADNRLRRTVVRYRRTSTLMVGDGVLTINGLDVADKSSDQVASLLDSTGQRQTTVLTVCRTVETPASAATGTIRSG